MDKETLLQKLEKFKVILSIAVIVVPILVGGAYYTFDKIVKTNQFISKLQGVDAAELANTLDWLELEILRIRYVELIIKYEQLTEATQQQHSPELTRILNDHRRNVWNAIQANNERQADILKRHRDRNIR